jgi:hypothetical protein
MLSSFARMMLGFITIRKDTRMDPDFEKRLRREFGLQDQYIDSLKNAGVNSDLDMHKYTARGIQQITGLPTDKAKRLADTFSFAQTITVKSNNPQNMSLRELLEELNSGDPDTDIVSTIILKSSSKSCFVQKTNSDEIDVDATLKCLQFIVDSGTTPSIFDGRAVLSLDQARHVALNADPLDGTPLHKGVALDGVDWRNVGAKQGEEYRLALVAFARLAKLLPEQVDRFLVAQELDDTKKLVGLWKVVKVQYDQAVKTNPALIEEAKAALIFRKDGQQAGSSATA